MFIAGGRWNRGEASLESCVFFARGLRVHLMTTRALTFDSRYLCPLEGQSDAAGTLVALIEGQATYRDSVGEAPQERTRTVFRFENDEYERRHINAPVLRLYGATRRSVEISMPREVMRMQTRFAVTPPELDAIVECMANDTLSHEERSRACIQLCDVLALHGLTSTRLSAQAQEAVPESVQRVCQALIRLYARLDTGAYLELLAGLAGVSPRQATRDMVMLLEMFPVSGRTFREMVKVLRIRRAALLLSAPNVTATAIAKDVGYGGLDAMARAFRDVGLPPPSAIRAELRSADTPPLD